LNGKAYGCLITLLVQEPDVAQSSGEVGGIGVQVAAVPSRQAVALGMVDVAMLMLRASAVLLLASPVLLVALLVFA
jgi:hypothetical protein